MIFLTYLAKMVLCSTVLLGYYWLFLRNRRFHHYNRFYLLLTLGLSLTLPLISLPVLIQPDNKLHQAVRQVTTVVELPYWTPTTPATQQAHAQVSNAATLFTLSNAFWLLYLAGVALLLFAFGKSLYCIYRLTRQYPYQRFGSVRFYYTDEPDTPFSFFRLLFWNNRLSPDTPEGHQILRHELFHVQQRHSVDVVLAELVCIAGWFNPVFHLIRRELKTIHEFLADQYAVSGHDRFAYATLLVQQAAQQKTISLSHYFSYQPIKRRIAMITTNKQNAYSYWSRLLALPMLVIVTCAITLKAQEVKPPKKVVNADIVQTPSAPTPFTTSTRPAEPLTAPAPIPAKTSSQPVKIVQYKWTSTPAGGAPIDIEKVRMLGRGTSMKKVQELLGEPQQKALSNNGGSWIYHSGETQLSIQFDRMKDEIQEFSYASLLSKKNSESINYDAVRMIKEQATTLDNIRKEFGTPLTIYMAPERERWEYKTNNKQLIVEFAIAPAKEPVVHAFQYTESNH